MITLQKSQADSTITENPSAEDQAPEDGDEKSDTGSEKKDTESEKTESANGDEGKKRKIGCNNEEVLAVLGHELGHWALSHNLKNLAISQVGTSTAVGRICWMSWVIKC